MPRPLFLAHLILCFAFELCVAGTALASRGVL